MLLLFIVLVPDVKPIHLGLDVIDHLWNRVGHLADAKAMFDGKI